MKKYYLLPILAISANVFSQFNINGQIENYTNKPIIVKLFENGTPKAITNTKTDAKGNFVSTIPVKYNGMIRLELPSGGSLNLISDNENIKFKTAYGEDMQTNLLALEGNGLKEYISIQKLNPLNDVNINILPYLKEMYTANDAFYKAITAEQARIDALNKSQPINSNFVKYINQISKLAGNLKSNITPDAASEIINHIENDNDFLEHSGFLPELIYAYINYQFNNNPNNSPEENLNKATELLLQKNKIQTKRGQNILGTILTIIPEANFPNFVATYKPKLANSKSLNIGDKAPDIKFETAINGKKSLYDIKANQKIVVFWASWCPACINEMPFVKEYYTNFKKNGGEIVAISLDYDQNAFNNATKDYPWYNYSDLLKWDSPIAESYNVQSTPTLFLLDKDNKIIKKVNHINDL